VGHSGALWWIVVKCVDKALSNVWQGVSMTNTKYGAFLKKFEAPQKSKKVEKGKQAKV
jgi:hypothetical protein